MQKYKKIILYIILVLLVLISFLILSAPKLINLDSFKKTIINKLSDETGGKFTIGKIDFSFFPTLNIVVRNASFEIENNNKISGTLDSISIYPKLIQLINKKIEIKEIVINSPRSKFFGENPVTNVKFLEENNQIERVLTLDEQERLISFSPPYLKPIIQTALNTGMRKSEIISLRWPNVDLENNIITIAATNSKSKRIKRIPTNSLRTCFELARKKSKVEDLRFHDLRHTAPTSMVETG